MSCGKKEKISITLDSRLLEMVDDVCRRENRRRSNLIETVLLRHFVEEPLPVESGSRPIARVSWP